MLAVLLVYYSNAGLRPWRQKCCSGVDIQLWGHRIRQRKCLCSGKTRISPFLFFWLCSLYMLEKVLPTLACMISFSFACCCENTILCWPLHEKWSLFLCDLFFLTNFVELFLFSQQIAVGTDDVYKTAEAIKLCGGKITREPGPLPGINTKITACLDPDGWKSVWFTPSR